MVIESESFSNGKRIRSLNVDGTSGYNRSAKEALL